MSGKYPLDYTVVQKLSSEELFNIIDDWLNSNSFGSTGRKNFSEALNCTHRTLQQLFVGWFLNVLIQYGKDHQDNFYDLRNEAAVMTCRKLYELEEAGEIQAYLPLI